jgi:hypothetical protein
MRGVLRSAIGTVPNPADYQTVMEPHARGALLVATIFDAFVAIYNLRTADLKRISAGELSSEIVERLSAEAARAARQVLDICIRAIDYCPPVDITFGDYLRALVTADLELVPVDPAGYRLAFLEAFRQRGLYPLDVSTLSVESLKWQTADEPGSAARMKKVVNALRQYAEKCTYVTSRERLFNLTTEAREKMRGMVLEIMKDDAAGREAVQTFGLDASDWRCWNRSPRAEDGAPVHAGWNSRHAGDHGDYASRTVPIDPSDTTMGTFEFVGGCTVVVNLKKPNLDYVVVKNINAPNRLAASPRLSQESGCDGHVRIRDAGAVWFSCTVGILRDPEDFIFRNADLQRVVFHTELSFRSLYSEPPLGRLLVEVAGRPARRAIRLEIEKTLRLGLFIHPGERIHGAAGAGSQWNPSRPCPFPRDVWRRGIRSIAA